MIGGGFVKSINKLKFMPKEQKEFLSLFEPGSLNCTHFPKCQLVDLF